MPLQLDDVYISGGPPLENGSELHVLSFISLMSAPAKHSLDLIKLL